MGTSGSEAGQQRPSRKTGRAQLSDPYTYVPTWTVMVYVAFVFGVYPRRVLGWRAAGQMTTPLVLDALEMALWTPRSASPPSPGWCIAPTSAQHSSITFTERLLAAGIDGSVGSVGDANDNALAEFQIGCYNRADQTPTAPGATSPKVEAATLDCIDDLTPIETEQLHYRLKPDLAEAG